MFREDKATAMAVYFLQQAGGELNDIKLMKLLYLAERRSLEQKNSTITGDSFVIMKHGQVLSSTLRRMSPHLESSDPATVWRNYIAPCNVARGNIVRLSDPKDHSGLNVGDILSRFDQGILQSIWAEFGHMDKNEIRDYCHGLPECVEIPKGRLTLEVRQIFDGMEFSREEVSARMSDLDYNRRVDELFDSYNSHAY